jgi:hypothetical protein
VNTTKQTNPRQQAETRLPEPETGDADQAHHPRKMTFAENVILTIKVLVGFGLLGALLWAANVWTTAK